MVGSDAAPPEFRPARGPGGTGGGPSLPLALILLGAALNVAWLGLLGWAILRALSRLFA